VRYFIIIVILLATFCLNLLTRANELPPCGERPTFIDPPWINGQNWCLEEVIRDESAGELGFTALAAAPDGTLYAARPLYGQVLALTDENGDGLLETAQIAIEGLTTPNGLAYFDDALYISGGANIYRFADGELEILAEDVPSGGGFWTGGLTIGADERIYVATGAACDFCPPDDLLRGAILSYALDGSDRQVIATGLRQPTDLAFRDGELWTVDTARDALFDTPDLDELNRVTTGANFGFPYCIGMDNQPDTLDGDFDCTQATAPAMTFPTHSTPLGMALYDSDTFPHVQGNLLIALGGSSNQAILQGYVLAAVSFDDDGNPTGYHIIIPEQSAGSAPIDLQAIHYQASGFWPRRPLDVTVSAEGWIYISISGGRILALRPN